MKTKTMKTKIIKGRSISKGVAEGEVLISEKEISFYGGVDPKTGIIVEKGHPLEGKSIKDKILVFPRGKGSTVGSYVLYRMKKNKTAPKALINIEAETIVAVGAIIAGIPMVDKLEKDPFKILKNGQYVKVNGDKGEIEIKINENK